MQSSIKVLIPDEIIIPMPKFEFKLPWAKGFYNDVYEDARWAKIKEIKCEVVDNDNNEP